MAPEANDDESILKDWPVGDDERELIESVIGGRGFHPNDLLVEDDGDGTSELRAKAFSELFTNTDNVLKSTYNDGHSGWPEDGYDWTDGTKTAVHKTDDNPTLYELMVQHTDEGKVKVLFNKCVWLKVKGAEASLLEIGVDALKTSEFGGFSVDEIAKIQQNICPDLGRIEPFPFNIPFNSICLDALNYRVIEVIEKKEVHGGPVKDFLDQGDHLRLVDGELKAVVLESIKTKDGSDEKYKIQELVSSIQANGFSPEFPLAVIPIREDFDIRKEEDLVNLLNAGEVIEFIVVDGNRRWTALNAINGYIDGAVVYSSKPMTQEKMTKVLGSVPVIVKPARDAEDLKHIRLSTQTLHHHVGQEPWGPYSKARNVKASYDSAKGSLESRMEVMKAKWGMKPNDIKNQMRTLSVMDKSVNEGFLEDTKKSEKFGALKGVVGSDRWCKWVGMERPRLDHWVGDGKSTDRIKSTFDLFNSDGYAQARGTHLNQQDFTRAIASASDKIEVLVAAGTITAEKVKNILTVTEAAALTLAFVADLSSFLPKIESYAALAGDDKAELLDDASVTSTKFSQAHTRMNTMNEAVLSARTAHQQEELERLPPWIQEYLDNLEDEANAKIVIKGLLGDEEKKKHLIDPNFILEDSDEFEGLHAFIVPLLAVRPEPGDVPAEVVENDDGE
jgi:hypothetical protein